jgi:hypothetical protein
MKETPQTLYLIQMQQLELLQTSSHLDSLTMAQSSERVSNQIIRVEVEESGDNTSTFEGSLECYG